MSREHRKYVREDSVKMDVGQTCFRPDGSLRPLPTVHVESSSIDVEKMVMCPFCLATNKIQRFLVSTKTGISSSKAECPECKNGMLMRTLLREWTPEAFAEWVYEYRRSGYWQKVQFEAWKKRLEQLGWSRPFWDHYGQIKEENKGEDESYSDYMNRQGEEMAQQWNDQEAEQ